MTVGFQRCMWTSLSFLHPKLSICYGLFNSDVHKSDYIVGCGMKPNLIYDPGICCFEVLGEKHLTASVSFFPVFILGIS